MKSLLRSAFLISALLPLALPAPPVRADAAKGFFGFVLSVDASGVLHPTINSITVKAIVPNSPAAHSGIKIGDQIFEVAGHAVAGSKASTLQPLMQKQVGQPLDLRLKHPDGTKYDVTLVAVAKPASP